MAIIITIQNMVDAGCLKSHARNLNGNIIMVNIIFKMIQIMAMEIKNPSKLFPPDNIAPHMSSVAFRLLPLQN